MGDHDNLTEEDFESLSKKWKTTLKSTKLKVLEMLKKDKLDHQTEQLFIKAAKAWGQEVTEAKNNTQKLLQDKLEL